MNGLTFGQAEAPEDFALCHPRQKSLLLLGGSKVVDSTHDKCALNTHGTSITTIYPIEHDESASQNHAPKHVLPLNFSCDELRVRTSTLHVMIRLKELVGLTPEATLLTPAQP